MALIVITLQDDAVKGMKVSVQASEPFEKNIEECTGAQAIAALLMDTIRHVVEQKGDEINAVE